MKVLCLDISNVKTPHLILPEHWISVGEVYTVTGEFLNTDDGHVYYYLAERRTEPLCRYRANMFIPFMESEQDLSEEEVVVDEEAIAV